MGEEMMPTKILRARWNTTLSSATTHSVQVFKFGF